MLLGCHHPGLFGPFDSFWQVSYAEVKATTLAVMAKDIALGRGEELSTWNQVRDQGGQTGPAQEKGQNFGMNHCLFFFFCQFFRDHSDLTWPDQNWFREIYEGYSVAQHSLSQSYISILDKLNYYSSCWVRQVQCFCWCPGNILGR